LINRIHRQRMEGEREDWNDWSAANPNHPLAALWRASESSAAEPVQVRLARLEVERVKAGRPAITAGTDVTGGPFMAETGAYASPMPITSWGGQGGFTLDWDKRHKENE